MAADFNVPDSDMGPGVLTPEDPRIPEAVRNRFGGYARTVVKVVPVIGVGRQEWWLFDAEDGLLDVISPES